MEDKDLYNRLLESVEALSLEPTEKVLVASIADQRICLFVHGKSYKDYRMSSSKRPPSCLEDSLGTPWGLHEVCEKTAIEEWSLEDSEENFKKAFILEVASLPEITKEGSNKKLLKDRRGCIF